MPQPPAPSTPFPAAPGDYVLWLALAQPAGLTIGRLGRIAFPAGAYAYAGSARGPGGLAGRLKHHLAVAAQPHWHIDYLRAVATLSQVWWLAEASPREHQWAAALACMPGAVLVVPRFGASDCTCPAHLVYFASLPPVTAFSERTGDQPNVYSLYRNT